MSYANPVNLGDPVIQQLDNGNSPTGTLETTPILRLGDTGKNLQTGQLNQTLPLGDPDSMKTLADGSLLLTSDNDPGLTIVAHPGTPQQSASFISFPAGTSGIDDAIMPTASSGTFYITNTCGNDTLKVAVTGLIKTDIYVSVGSDNAVDQLDPKTGVLTPIITGLNSPAGLLFVPSGADPSASTVAGVMSDAIAGGLPGLAKDLLPDTAAFGSAGNFTASQPAGGSSLSHQAAVASPFAADSLMHHS
jgi:hypothetical protein